MQKNRPDPRSASNDRLDPDTATEATSPAVLRFTKRLMIVALAALLVAPWLVPFMERTPLPPPIEERRPADHRVSPEPETRAEPCSDMAPKYRAGCTAIVRAEQDGTRQTRAELAKRVMVPQSLADWLEPCAALPIEQRPLCERDTRASYACTAHGTDEQVDKCMQEAAAHAHCRVEAGRIRCRPPPSAATCSKVGDAWHCP